MAAIPFQIPPLFARLAPLPIDELLPEIAAQIQLSPCLVIEAPPGAGKTTRVPHLLLEQFPEGEIVVLEPRRIAAHLSAARVAEERGESLGESVGVQMRFDSVIGPNTRLRFVTEGVLLRQLLSDPLLRGVRVVILDEFHERHLQADLVLALVRRLQQGPRPDLRLVVMSATMPGGQIAAFLNGCPVVRSQGRSFPIEISYLQQPSTDPLGKQIRAALREALRTESGPAAPPLQRVCGDVLIFLPGTADIRRCQEDLAELVEPFQLEIFPLHGDLPLAEQRRAITPRSNTARRKIILSTNVAETSVTVDGVTLVIDSGLARIAGHSPWSGLPTLRTQAICRAAAAQRAGRAGRTQPGRCLRLYTRHDHDLRPEFEAPEIRRLDLAELLLTLRAAGLREDSLSFLDAPQASAVEAALSLLSRLGALDGSGSLTALGARLATLPLHPRLGRLLLAGQEQGVTDDAATIAALLSEREIRLALRGANLRSSDVLPSTGIATEPSDLLHLMDLFAVAQSTRFARASLQREGLDPDAVLAVERARKQLLRLTGRDGRKPTSPQLHQQALLKSILLAYPDRVARRRSKANGSEFVLAGGGTAQLSPSSVVRDAELVVLVDIEQRSGGHLPGKPAAQRPQARLASAVEADWLLDLPDQLIHETVEPSWNAAASRVEVLRSMKYDQLVLDESRQLGDGQDAAQQALLIAQVKAADLKPFRDGEDYPRLVAKLAFVQQHCPEQGLAPPTPQQLEAALASLCQGQFSFAGLADLSIVEAILQQQSGQGSTRSTATASLHLLNRLCPDHLVLSKGRRVKVNYVPGQAPWVESRLQDFLGMHESPTVAAGRVAVVLHLLAPNQRAVQVTTDLSGFWTRHYPGIRKELMRRYPRHAWPENPHHAE